MPVRRERPAAIPPARRSSCARRSGPWSRGPRAHRGGPCRQRRRRPGQRWSGGCQPPAGGYQPGPPGGPVVRPGGVCSSTPPSSRRRHPPGYPGNP